MDRREMTKSMLLILLCVLAYAVIQSGPVGLRLAVNDQGVSFQLKSSLAKIVFEFGQECSKSDGCGLLR
ncbi:hypothetical protein ACFQ1E_16800 [Sphingomonas canadensis]|uniref:Transmembrane protein n=1 Tax=Sphingomonas canadensis TaxID=1219257 RepID=A0ABW3H9R7_9SPHN|nr:hypothetical protein [Sphingomonas canadensis]MCW3837705.1 hypothetical protein [Sphingomonas canadensis]